MRLDLNNNTEQLDALPRFQLANKRVRKLSIVTDGCMQIAGILFVTAAIIALFTNDSFWLSLLFNNIAALLLLAAITQAAWRVDKWRCHLFENGVSQHPNEENGKQSTHEQPKTDSSKPSYITLKIERLFNLMGANVVWVISLSIASLIMVYLGWNTDLTVAIASKVNYAAAGILVITAFALLVIERHISSTPSSQWPEAIFIGLMIRMVIGVQLVSLCALLFVDVGRVWPLRLLVMIGLLPAIVAIELIIRALLSIFSPQRDTLEPRLIAKSFITAMLHWPPKPLQLLQDEIQHHFGIDLRQVWAFGFMRRAFSPILLLILVIGWLLSSVSEVPINGRGIYERFGRPITVLKSGLHLGLPWPFGKVVAVENGVIHEIATSNEEVIKNGVKERVEKNETIEKSTVEGDAPESANRLWDASHRSEKSQVIASAANNKQSFEVLNMDVRFIYRIGLRDQDALDVTYNNSDIPTLIQSTANRILVKDFASKTLDDVLTGQRKELTANILHSLQRDLDQMKSGVEILAVVIEAIHPPAGAANAYHSVQAAQITAQALISKERSQAAEKTSSAHITATKLTDTAESVAKEGIASAKSDTIRFNAEKAAWHDASKAFLFEQYLSQLNDTLAQTPLLIIDHRLTTVDSPTIDLRNFTTPANSIVKSNTQHTGD